MSAAHASALDDRTPGAKAYTNGEVGVLLFLATEVMLFAGLIAAVIVLRASDPRWASAAGFLSRPAGMAGMLLLVLGSSVLGRAIAKPDGTVRALRAAAAIAPLFGVVFLVLQGWEYRTLLSDGRGWSRDVFTSCFWVLTGVHGLHVLGGVAWLLVLAARAASGGSDAVALRASLRLASWYWHLVDAVWLVLYVLFYLL